MLWVRSLTIRDYLGANRLFLRADFIYSACINYSLGVWVNGERSCPAAGSDEMNSNAVCIGLPLHARLNLQTVTILLNHIESCWQNTVRFTDTGIFQIKYNLNSVHYYQRWVVTEYGSSGLHHQSPKIKVIRFHFKKLIIRLQLLFMDYMITYSNTGSKLFITFACL